MSNQGGVKGRLSKQEVWALLLNIEDAGMPRAAKMLRGHIAALTGTPNIAASEAPARPQRPSDKTRQRAERGSMKAAFTAPVPDGWTGREGFIARVVAAAGDPNGSATFRRLFEDEARRLGVPIPKR